MENKSIAKYIERIEIKGLWGRYDIDWQLNPDVNILVGENGTGKSTILQAVKNLFDVTEKIAKDVSVSEDLHAIPCDKIDVTFKNNAESDHFVFDKDSILSDASISYEVGSDSQKGFLYEHKYSTINNHLKNAVSEVFKEYNIYHIKTFDKAIKNGADDYKTTLDIELNRLEKEYLGYKLKTFKAALKDKNALRANQYFNASINEFFKASDKILNEDDEKLSFLLDDNTPLNWLLLSSGEKQLLIILLTVLCQNEKPSILMMDEPELSLHVSWQYELIKIIRQLNPNCQIIIVTHSSSIFAKGWMDKFFFVNGKQGIRHKIKETV